MKLKTFNKTNGAVTRASDPMITVAKTGLFALNAALCKALNLSIGGGHSRSSGRSDPNRLVY